MVVVRRDERGARVAGRGPLVATIGIAVTWVVAVVAVAATGGFVVGTGTPPWPILAAVVGPLAAFAALWRVPGVSRVILGIDPVLVVAVQLWRVVGGAFLFGWTAGDLDAEFAIPAGVGDIATGLAALLLLGVLRRRSLTRSHLVGFTALGVGDFTIAVVTGAVIGPDGLEMLPWVLFPALAVPIFSIVHILNWVQLAPLVASWEGSARPTPSRTVRATRAPAADSLARHHDHVGKHRHIAERSTEMSIDMSEGRSREGTWTMNAAESQSSKQVAMGLGRRSCAWSDAVGSGFATGPTQDVLDVVSSAAKHRYCDRAA